jgi:alpha-beta hydrolase superfamily lysophospholipase
MASILRIIAGGALLVTTVLAMAAHTYFPIFGAGALLHPSRRHATHPAPVSCIESNFDGAGVVLKGWRCRPDGALRGTIVFLHGVADNRESATGLIPRFERLGFATVAYDSRANGNSEGEFCTYGFFEKQDLRKITATLDPGPVVLVGWSLGGAVALQEAPDDPRVMAVVAAESFSDLRTVATERAPRYFSASAIDRSFALAESQAGFVVDEVDAARAAARIAVPVLIIHGDSDTETPTDHSRRIYDALRGPKELILVPGVGHNQSLRAEVWDRVEQWIDGHVPVVAATKSVPAPSPVR